MKSKQHSRNADGVGNLGWWFIGVVTLLVLPFLLYKSQSVDYQQYNQFIGSVAEIRELDTRLNETLLLVNQNPNMSYDRVARGSNKLFEASQRLWQTVEPELMVQLRDHQLVFARSLEEKLELVESYKSHHAVMKNSSTYFSFIARSVIDDRQAPEEVARTINDILHAIHLFRIDHSNAHLESVKMLREKLQQELKSVGMSGAPLYEVMHIHTGLIFRYALEITDQLDQILKINLLQQLTEIQYHYAEYHDEQERTASLYRFALFAVSLILALAVVVTLSKQRGSVRDLNDALNEVEFQKHALDEHAIVSIADVKGNIIYANQKFCDISGYSLEELKGKNHRLVKSGEHPPEFFHDMWRTIANGMVWHGDIHNVSRNGDNYWVRSTIVPFLNDQGKPFRYVSIRTDITERKLMEQEISQSHKFLTGITENIGECVYVLDENGNCSFLNKEAERQLGWRQEELLGENIHDAIHYQNEDGTPMPQAECPAHLSIKDGLKYHADDQFFTRKDGTLFPVSIVSVPLMEGDKPMGSVTVFQDISQRRLNEQQLKDARDAAEHTSRMKSEFLANMSHEIRTPMNGMLGTIELLRDTPLNESQYEYVEAAHRSSEHLLTLINDILDLSKLESGNLELEHADFDLAEALEDLADLYAANANGKGLQLNWGMAADVPEWVKGDRVRLWQVLTNLTGNAIKFTEQGSVSIQTTLQHAGESLQLRFEVTDTGIGIPVEAQRRIFNAFEQADGSMTRRFGGTGLGLSLSKRLVEMMGGEIGIESSPGAGSTFWFSVTMGRSQLSTELSHEESLHNKRVLIVDDVALNRTILERFTLQWQMRPSSVSSSEQALQELERVSNQGESYDVALIDHKMAGMDGLTLANHIRQQQRFAGCKLVLHSSDAEKLSKQPEKLTSLDAILRKPLRRRTLHHQLLRLYGYQQQQPAQSFGVSDSNNWLHTRVLLVDDNDVNRMIARGMLEKQGITAIEMAENGMQALEMVKENSYDLVLMDIQMPVMNGHEASRAIRQLEGDKRDTTIIAVTAHAFADDIDKCLAAGMNDYLSKPLQQTALQSTLDKWLGASAADKGADNTSGEEKAGMAETLTQPLELSGDGGNIDMATVHELSSIMGEEGMAMAVGSYLDNCPQQISAMRDGLAAGDWPLLTRSAHTLKGSSGSFGAITLVQLAQQVEQLGQAEADDGIASLIDQIDDEFSAVKRKLEGIL